MKQTKYAFLDRDGTLMLEPQDTYQINSVKELRILDGVIKGLKLLTKRGYALVMVTNQDGLGTPGHPSLVFNTVQKKLFKTFAKNGISFTHILICPHMPDKKCDCRKPGLGLVEKLLSKGDMDRSSSFVCGDRKSDEEFAKNIGVRFAPMKTNGDLYSALTAGGIV